MKYMNVKLIGRSMEPLLTVGDILLVKKVSANELAVGDIIVYETSTKLRFITHRILALNPDGTLMTKADISLIRADSSPIPFHKVVGKVMAAYRGTKVISIKQKSVCFRRGNKMLAWLNNSSVFLRIQSLVRFCWLSVLIHIRINKMRFSQVRESH